MKRGSIELPFEDSQYGDLDPPEIVSLLIHAWKTGGLGGSHMPEDAAPTLPDDEERARFFTLPMALNYQRNSYRLWESAAALYNSDDGKRCFDPFSVGEMDDEELREMLVGYRVALQPNRHVAIWRQVSETLAEGYSGSVLELIEVCGRSVGALSETIQVRERSGFPYLAGPKIFNYWLYVMEQYVAVEFVDRELISVAPDTHVVQATIRLGIVPGNTRTSARAQEIVALAWRDALRPLDMAPIDIHTPLWLWSRGGFVPLR